MAATTETEPTIQWLSDEESREAFDAEARKWLDISGDEFLRRWDGGEYAEIADDADHPTVMSIAMLIPLVRP